jgi:hypothetical protein
MTPERLLSSDELPPELRCIAAEHRLQRDDPAFLLLAWHWKQTEGHENRLRSLTVELTSVIDLRLRKLAEVSSSLDRMPEAVEALLLALRSSGLLHGPHGTGKSYVLHRWTERLNPKQHRLVRLSHCSLAGGDLLRHLVRLTGREPKFRKSDNVALLSACWQEWGPGLAGRCRRGSPGSLRCLARGTAPAHLRQDRRPAGLLADPQRRRRPVPAA